MSSYASNGMRPQLVVNNHKKPSLLREALNPEESARVSNLFFERGVSIVELARRRSLKFRGIEGLLRRAYHNMKAQAEGPRRPDPANSLRSAA